MSATASNCRQGVSVCFPAYEEETDIRDALMEANALLEASDLDYELLVCNDGSSDRTGAIIDDVARSLPKLRVFHHPNNRGIRATFEHLYSESTREWVFLNAVDRQWPTAVLFELLPLATQFDVVIASRRQKPYGLVRSFVSWTFNVIPRLLFGVSTWDAGAVKLVRREIISRYELVSLSPFSEAERLIRASRDGYRIGQIAVEVGVRTSGRARGVSVRSVVAAVGDVVRVASAIGFRAPSPRQ